MPKTGLWFNYGGTFEDFPYFSAKIAAMAQEVGVPIYMVHYSPFGWGLDAHLAPGESVISYPLLKKLLNDIGLAKIPVSLETVNRHLNGWNSGHFFEVTQLQKDIETILASRFPIH